MIAPHFGQAPLGFQTASGNLTPTMTSPERPGHFLLIPSTCARQIDIAIVT